MRPIDEMGVEELRGEIADLRDEIKCLKEDRDNAEKLQAEAEISLNVFKGRILDALKDCE